MSQTVETQRAIIEGDSSQRPGRVCGVRARLAVPPTATLLEIADASLSLVGYWTPDKGFRSLIFSGLPKGPENQFHLDIQPDPVDDPNLVYMITPRMVIVGP